MIKETTLMVILMINAMIFCVEVHAGKFTDIRCCEEPRRDKSGKIIRSQSLIKFMDEQYPLPSHLKKEDYHWNHAIPLVCGGRDIPENLLRMHVDAKNCAEDYCQDLHEQQTMCIKSYKRENY